MTIKQSVLNTFDRVGIDYNFLVNKNDKVTVENRFSGEKCDVLPIIAECIRWIYKTSDAYEDGNRTVNVSDFDRVRYFVSEIDTHAYMVCVD